MRREEQDSGTAKRFAKFSDAASVALREMLLAWYYENRRDLPWRRTVDPYAIWVSEIMLQQTRVAAVVDKYEAFLRNFPTVEALAAAAEEDVLALWSGLGYYRRARMMHRAAKMVATEFRGVMPVTAGGLRILPGVGSYTSAAIASIAYGEAVAVVDGNVERVVQRLAGWGSALPGGQAGLARDTARLANALLDASRAGDFNQAMMELGATVCLPRNPKCLFCPIRKLCRTQGEHPTAPRAKMRSENAAFALVLRDGLNGFDEPGGREVLLQRRALDLTVMPGMWELPALREVEKADADLPMANLLMAVRHAIMQVNYYVRIWEIEAEDLEAVAVPSLERRWFPLIQVEALPLTGLTRKVLLRAKQKELGPKSPQNEMEELAEPVV